MASLSDTDAPVHVSPHAAVNIRLNLARRLESSFPSLAPVQRLALLRDNIVGPLVFTTSFGLEDQVLTHLAVTSGVEIDFVTLDTGRLFPETYDVWAETEQRYRIRIKAYNPRSVDVQTLVETQGINGFYRSQSARIACCHVRKVEPLARALHGAACWVTGLRAEQSANRQGLRFVDIDAGRGLLKANPLLDWTRDQIAALVASAQIPLSPLHDRGFLSIGCAPCTRAVAPDEHERAGRWWWETKGPQECGLHVSPDGRLVRGAVT